MAHPSLDDLIRDSFRVAWRPPPDLLPSVWAERFRYLSPEASAEPGLWRNAAAPYLPAIMDSLSPKNPTERVVFKSASQSGKTECILNFIGYIIDLDPGPILAIQPNVTPMGEAFSKDRIKPMLRDSPSLAAKIGQLKGRTSAQTITHMQFPGGHLTIVGANSPAGLASRPIRYLVCDELDRWEITKEGDPLDLARKRLQTYRARRMSKELIVSSPTYADLGISRAYDACSQQWQWQLPCQHCGASQFPEIKHFSNYEIDPKRLRYACQHCGAVHGLDDSDAIRAGGRWICTQKGPADSVGYWLNQFASHFARWDDTLADWNAAGNDPARRQVVVNTSFAQAWEGEGEKIEPSMLSSRAESWDQAPNAIVAVTMGCDVQGDRLEVETVGWGPGYQSWSLAYDVLPGEPTQAEVWQDLLDLYRQTWTRQDGQILRPVAMAVDSGAYTQHVYGFVKRAHERGIIPIKGLSGMERDALAGDRRMRLKRAAQRLREGRPPEMLGVDAIKRTVYHHLLAPPGMPGYAHFPEGRHEEYYLQLTGERLMIHNHRGRRPDRRWVPIHNAVEALDCRVYAYAALLLSHVDLSPQSRREADPAASQVQPVAAPTAHRPPKISRRSSSWL